MFYTHSIFPTTYEIGATVIPELTDEETGLRGMREPVQGCAAVKSGRQDPHVTVKFQKWSSQTSICCDSSVRRINKSRRGKDAATFQKKINISVERKQKRNRKPMCRKTANKNNQQEISSQQMKRERAEPDENACKISRFQNLKRRGQK